MSEHKPYKDYLIPRECMLLNSEKLFEFFGQEPLPPKLKRISRYVWRGEVEHRREALSQLGGALATFSREKSITEKKVIRTIKQAHLIIWELAWMAKISKVAKTMGTLFRIASSLRNEVDAFFMQAEPMRRSSISKFLQKIANLLQEAAAYDFFPERPGKDFWDSKNNIDPMSHYERDNDPEWVFKKWQPRIGLPDDYFK